MIVVESMFDDFFSRPLPREGFTIDPEMFPRSTFEHGTQDKAIVIVGERVREKNPGGWTTTIVGEENRFREIIS